MLDYLETVAEEITLMLGLNTKVNGKTIQVETIAGYMNYKPAYTDVMRDVYRFIFCYGLKLQNYGLKMNFEQELIIKK